VTSPVVVDCLSIICPMAGYVSDPKAAPTAFNLDHDLRWVDEETERANIDEIRLRFADDLKGCTEDMTHDIAIARFLRGHNNDLEESAEFFINALRARKEMFASSGPIAEFRAANMDAVQIDPSVLPFYKEAGYVLPLRGLVGCTSDNLPVIASSPRFIDYEAIADKIDTDEMDIFLKCCFEQRAIVLHNLSMQQKRMVKLIDLRDLNQFSILTLLTTGRALVSKLKDFIKSLQDLYPEILHQVIIFNAPTTFAKLFAVLALIMNERMKAKVLVKPPVEAFSYMTRRFTAKAITSWMAELDKHITFKDLEIPAGCEEFKMLSLKKGQVATWKLSVADKDVNLRYVFIADEAKEDSEPELEEVSVSGEPHEGTLVAESDGIIWMCISNYHSWMKSKTVDLVLE